MALSSNPFRGEVLMWYRRCLKAAFTVPWESDEDALYVLEESRRLFRQNQHISDLRRVERKVREVEMRYELALHYRIPYPRPFHKTQGSMQESGVSYAAYLDSSYDFLSSPYTTNIAEGSVNAGVMGGSGSASHYYDEVLGTADVDGRAERFDTVPQPVSAGETPAQR